MASPSLRGPSDEDSAKARAISKASNPTERIGSIHWSNWIDPLEEFKPTERIGSIQWKAWIDPW